MPTNFTGWNRCRRVKAQWLGVTTYMHGKRSGPSAHCGCTLLLCVISQELACDVLRAKDKGGKTEGAEKGE